MNKSEFFIPNITCGHCVMTIQRELGNLSGVKEVRGDPDTKKIIVEYDDPASTQKIKETLKEINYPVEEGG